MGSLLGSSYVTRKVGSERRSGAAWRSAAAPVRQLFWRVRARLRNAVLRPRRGAARFGYDLRSYYHNFDDGLVSAH